MGVVLGNLESVSDRYLCAMLNYYGHAYVCRDTASSNLKGVMSDIGVAFLSYVVVCSEDFYR